MRDRICIVCGEKAVKNNFCEEHFLKRNSLAEVPEVMHLNRCKNCKKFHIKNDLKSVDEKSAVKETLENNINMENVHDLEITRMTNNRIYIKLKGKLDDLEKEEEYTIFYKPTKRLCDTCSKKKGGYYEGVIQIRPKSIEALGKIIRDESIVGIEELKEGFDVYILSRRDLPRLESELEDMTVEKKRSYTQAGVSDSGKKLSRTTILLRVEEKD